MERKKHGFFGLPLLQHVAGYSDRWVVVRGFTYASPDGCVVRVGSGWETDGASVPRALWAIFPPMSGPYMEAAVLHDALYRAQPVSRKRADELFLEAMKALGVPAWKRWSIYGAVRAFGWRAWRENEKLTPQQRPQVEVYRCGK